MELLEKLQGIESSVVSSEEFSENYKVTLSKANKGIKFKLHHDSFIFSHDKWDFKNLNIKSDDLEIKVPFMFFTKQSNRISCGKIPTFEFGKFNKEIKAFHRLVLPVDGELNFMFSIENVGIEYNYKNKFLTREATEIEINDKKFHLFLAKNKSNKTSNQNYLILESKSPMEYSEFSEYCFSILICFGYISGDFINNDGYFFQYDNIEMIDPTGLYYSQMRGSIKCQYVPIYSNPYGYIHNSEISDLYKNKVRTLYINEFSKLCQLCHSNDDVKSILLLLIEVHTQTLVSGPGILSIALETIANVVYEENETKLAPIKSKAISKKIRQSLIKTLELFMDDVGEEGIAIIKNRINQINQRTNRDKLLIPFNILKIPISTIDIEAIEQRNAFLHGKTPMVNSNDSKNLNEADKFRYYLYLKIYVLISSVILKYVGYDNYIVNYPKIYEKSTGIKLEEDHYRLI